METESRSWVLKRNCVMTPHQLLGAFGVLAAGSVAVSVAWALSGAWLVIPFMLIELTALAVAFLVYSRHVNDGEKITLDETKVRVDVTQGAKTETRELPRQWLRCGLEEGQCGLVRLRSQQSELLVGRFASPVGRERFYREFRSALGLG